MSMSNDYQTDGGGATAVEAVATSPDIVIVADYVSVDVHY